MGWCPRSFRHHRNLAAQRGRDRSRGVCGAGRRRPCGACGSRCVRHRTVTADAAERANRGDRATGGRLQGTASRHGDAHLGRDRRTDQLRHEGAGRTAADDDVGILRYGSRYPWQQDRPGMYGKDIRIRKQPVGVIAAVVPWNMPQFLTVTKVIPALLAGCPVVLKPAPRVGARRTTARGSGCRS